MPVLWTLKQKISEEFGTQVVGAKTMGFTTSRLSNILRGHVVPTERELKILSTHLGDDVLENFRKAAA